MERCKNCGAELRRNISKCKNCGSFDTRQPQKTNQGEQRLKKTTSNTAFENQHYDRNLFVENGKADIQIKAIRSYVKNGLVDSEIAAALNEAGHLKLQTNSVWTTKDITEVIAEFDLRSDWPRYLPELTIKLKTCSHCHSVIIYGAPVCGGCLGDIVYGASVEENNAISRSAHKHDGLLGCSTVILYLLIFIATPISAGVFSLLVVPFFIFIFVEFMTDKSADAEIHRTSVLKKHLVRTYINCNIGRGTYSSGLNHDLGWCLDSMDKSNGLNFNCCLCNAEFLIKEHCVGNNHGQEIYLDFYTWSSRSIYGKGIINICDFCDDYITRDATARFSDDNDTDHQIKIIRSLALYKNDFIDVKRALNCSGILNLDTGCEWSQNEVDDLINKYKLTQVIPSYQGLIKKYKHSTM